MRKRLTVIAFVVAALFMLQAGAFAAEPIDAVKAKIKASVKAAVDSVPSITVEELKKAMDKGDVFFELIDVRTDGEYAAGYLADAIHAPRGKAEWIIPGKIKDPNAKIIVYCKAGARGAFVVKMLLDAGYTDVTNVTGGFGAWVKAGYPYYNAHGENVITKDGYGKKPE